MCCNWIQNTRLVVFLQTRCALSGHFCVTVHYSLLWCLSQHTQAQAKRPPAETGHWSHWWQTSRWDFCFVWHCLLFLMKSSSQEMCRPAKCFDFEGRVQATYWFSNFPWFVLCTWWFVSVYVPCFALFAQNESAQLPTKPKTKPKPRPLLNPKCFGPHGVGL